MTGWKLYPRNCASQLTVRKPKTGKHGLWKVSSDVVRSSSYTAWRYLLTITLALCMTRNMSCPICDQGLQGTLLPILGNHHEIPLFQELENQEPENRNSMYRSCAQVACIFSIFHFDSWELRCFFGCAHRQHQGGTQTPQIGSSPISDSRTPPGVVKTPNGQWVIRSSSDLKGFLGEVQNGTIKINSSVRA